MISLSDVIGPLDGTFNIIDVWGHDRVLFFFFFFLELNNLYLCNLIVHRADSNSCSV